MSFGDVLSDSGNERYGILCASRHLVDDICGSDEGAVAVDRERYSDRELRPLSELKQQQKN